MIAQELESEGLIRSNFFFRFYMFVNDRPLFAGTYRLSKSMSVLDIIKTLNSSNSLENETITLTFIEGRRLVDYISRMAENFDFTEEEALEVLNDQTYLETLIEKYWFITEDILNEDIFHPLEGYLFPDTYIFRRNSTIEDIVIKMLDTMESKLEIYKEDLDGLNYNIHEILTLASIVEQEGAGFDDRAGIAGVFINRLNDDWRLDADATTLYGVNKALSEQPTRRDLNACNPYNTRASCGAPSLPIGPIASPSLASIHAVIEPENHQYFFFVSDKNKKVYFTKTYNAHNRLVRDLQRQGLWYTY